jgi:hypothetical protein
MPSFTEIMKTLASTFTLDVFLAVGEKSIALTEPGVLIVLLTLSLGC